MSEIKKYVDFFHEFRDKDVDPVEISLGTVGGQTVATYRDKAGKGENVQEALAELLKLL